MRPVVLFAILFLASFVHAGKREKVHPMPFDVLERFKAQRSGVHVAKPVHSREEIGNKGGRWCKHSETRTLENRDLRAPSCAGSTSVCELPEVMLSYDSAIASGLLPSININTVAHTFGSSDQTQALTDNSQTSYQLGELNNAYAAAGITFSMSLDTTYNDYYYNMIVIDGTCPYSWISDGYCDYDCNYTETGYDGGDCLNVVTNGCAASSNGVCDMSCNFASTSWDHGDCCTASSLGTCRNPLSSYVSWTDMDGIKTAVGNSGSDTLNLFIVAFPSESLTLGISTFPWDSAALTVTNGVCFNAIPAWGLFSSYSYYGDTAVHEIGHALGLRHTHAGVTEVPGFTLTQICDDHCFESVATNLNGDMCEDTNPTPVNYQCQDPSCASTSSTFCSSCSGAPWTNTPYTNFMGYADDTCINTFSDHQLARMRCYLDDKLYGWTGETRPSVITRAPVINEITGTGLYVSWEAPLNFGSASSVTYTLERTPSFSSSVSGLTSLSYTDTTIMSGTTYSYRVMAVGTSPAYGFSPYSCSWVAGTTACGSGTFVTAIPPSPTPATIVNPVNIDSVLNDPSFEGTTVWSSTSTDGSTVLCSLSDSSCSGYPSTGSGYVELGVKSSTSTATFTQTFDADSGIYSFTFDSLIRTTYIPNFDLTFKIDGADSLYVPDTATSLFSSEYLTLSGTIVIPTSGTHTFEANFQKNSAGDLYMALDNLALIRTGDVDSASSLLFSIFMLLL